MASKTPALSVVICTRNRAVKLSRAVASVLASSFKDFELIVVDQSTDPKSAEAIAAFDDPRLRYVPTTTVGVSISRNLAIRLSRAEILVLTDDDCICDAQWLAAVHAEFEARPDALAVYGRVLPYGVQENMICPAVMESTTRLSLEGPAIPHTCLGSGNNMSFRKKLFRKVGLFRESLGAGTPLGQAEDTEFSYRVLWNRFRVVYSPVPLVYHDNWMSREQFKTYMTTSVRGLSVVFFAYTLRFDRVAAIQLLKTGYYVLCNNLMIGSVPWGLLFFAQGLFHGVLIRLSRPPSLEASA